MTVSIIMYFLPESACAWTICSSSAMLVAAGTVEATCLPAFSPAMLILACSWIGVLMCTASTLGSSSSL